VSRKYEFSNVQNNASSKLHIRIFGHLNFKNCFGFRYSDFGFFLGRHKSGTTKDKGMRRGVMAKILVVDDEKSIRTLCTEELEEEGYEVITSGKCKDVLELIASTQPSAVVLDIRMQDCNGLDLLQEVRSAYQDLPIILNTAYDSYREDVKSVAADHYVVKSIDLAELKAKLVEVLKGKNRS